MDIQSQQWLKKCTYIATMVVLLATLSLALLALQSEAFHVEHRAKCTKKQVCNGNLMCALVCERGTVITDDWTTKSLTYQRQLQANDKFLFFELPATHNSAITEADGFGIEKYFISALYQGRDLDQGDDVGEGNCQYLSLTDQLNMGVRHLEVDIWWDALKHDVIVCHSPVPLYPVGNVTRAAEAAGLTLDWDPKKMSCLGTKRSFSDVLREIQTWMSHAANLNEIVVVYFDTKFRLSPDQVTQANNEINLIFGKTVWKASDGSPLQTRVSDMLSAGKRIVFENMKDDWATPSSGDQVVFYPTLWTHQFSSESMTEFPHCVIQGDADWYGKTWVRALDGSFVEAATRCGVQIASGDYTNPDDMKFFVWSWDQDEPKILQNGCTALTPNGRWATLPCDTPLPFACVNSASKASGEYKTWTIDLTRTGASNAAVCPVGSEFAAPHNGFSNGLLVNAAFGQTLWLNAPVSW
jgi:hypothetical protein